MVNYKEKFDPNYYADLADDCAMIQAAVDEAAKTGDAVTIPRYNARTGKTVWDISRAIMLYTGSVIYLDNCHLRQADDVITNIFRNSNNETEIGCTREGRQSNIQIIGMGNCLLDGGIKNGLTEVNCAEYGVKSACENSMFNFMNVEQVTIRNIRITHHRYWAFVFHYSSHVQISGIDFYGPYHWRNQDGIDLRTGCSHFFIENLTGVLGDDVVAMTNLKNYRDELMAGCGYDDSIHNIVIRNIRATTRASFVRVLNHGGKKIYNVLIQDLMFDAEADPTDPRVAGYEPIHPEAYQFSQHYGVRIGQCHYFGNGPMAQLGDTYNITVRNITCRGLAAVNIGCAVSDVLIDNVRLYGEANTAAYFVQGVARNIMIRDVYYSEHCRPNPDHKHHDNRLIEVEYEGCEKDCEIMPEKQICMAYFKNTDADDITFRDVNVGKGVTAVFGGYGKVRVRTSNIKYPKDIPLTVGQGIEVIEE